MHSEVKQNEASSLEREKSLLQGHEEMGGLYPTQTSNSLCMFVFTCEYTSLFSTPIHPLPIRLFHVFSTVNNVATNMRVQMYFQDNDFIFFEYIPSEEYIYFFEYIFSN